MLPKFKSILCLNGRLPNKVWFSKHQDLILIAADGASNKLVNKDIVPDLIVGDLDSLELDFLNIKIKNINIKNTKHLTKKHNIIRVDDQNTTDFEKCLVEINKRSLFPSLVLGIAGGEIDHTIYNINCFMRYAKQHMLIFLDFYKDNKFKWGLPILRKKEIIGKVGKTISLLPYPEALVSTTGLKWDITKQQLMVSVNASIRNVVVEHVVIIEVHRGELLVVIDDF